MRQIFILSILLTSNSLLFAQDFPKFIQERTGFCDSNFSDEQVTQLRIELNKLEDYFVKKGLLTDATGTSYRNVYRQIVKEDDLNFVIDTTFVLLDSLEFQVYTGCFYKVLTPDQISELTFKHQEAAERIAERHSGDLTPRVVAQRIIDNLSDEDFELEFYQISSLLTFYKIASPNPPLNLVLPEFSQVKNTNLQTIQVFLNENGEIVINEDVLTLQNAEQAIYKFLSTEPKMKGVEFITSRVASYESYLNITEMFNSVYLKLIPEFGDIPKNIIFREPK